MQEFSERNNELEREDEITKEDAANAVVTWEPRHRGKPSEEVSNEKNAASNEKNTASKERNGAFKDKNEIPKTQKESQKPSQQSGEKNRGLPERKPLDMGIRMALIGLTVLLLIGAGVLFYLGNQRQEEEIENILYTYEYKSDTAYSVKLIPNTVFTEEWQPEGHVYPIKLTDTIWIQFNSALQVSNGSKLSGEYQIEAVIDAFQTGEQAVSEIYQRRYRLAEGVIDADGEALIQEAVEVKPLDFATLVSQIEEEMGGSTDKEFYVVLNGTIYIEDEQSPKEKSFTTKITLPINSTNVYYSITKPDPVDDLEKVTNIDIITGPKNHLFTYGGVALLSLGGLLLILVLLLTKSPNEDEKRRMYLRKIMKKNEDRIVAIPSLPSLNYLHILEVADLETLVNHSEDIRELVLVQKDEYNLPADNKFYLYAKDKVFVYEEKFNQA